MTYDLERENLDVKIEKLERKILELRMDLERRIEAKRGRVPQKQAGAEKVAEEVDQLVELERQRQRIEDRGRQEKVGLLRIFPRFGCPGHHFNIVCLSLEFIVTFLSLYFFLTGPIG